MATKKESSKTENSAENKKTINLYLHKLNIFPAFIPVVFLIVGIILNSLVGWKVAAGQFGAVIGLLLIIAGLIAIVLAIYEFNQQKIPINTMSPNFKLVTSGIYSFSRNPLYGGSLIACIGLSFSIDSMWMLILEILCFFYLHKYIIPHEEEAFNKKFGEEYKSYCDSTRRWI